MYMNFVVDPIFYMVPVDIYASMSRLFYKTEGNSTYYNFNNIILNKTAMKLIR